MYHSSWSDSSSVVINLLLMQVNHSFFYHQELIQSEIKCFSFEIQCTKLFCTLNLFLINILVNGNIISFKEFLYFVIFMSVCVRSFMYITCYFKKKTKCVERRSFCANLHLHTFISWNKIRNGWALCVSVCVKELISMEWDAQ
jgi:hypothetical protein